METLIVNHITEELNNTNSDRAVAVLGASLVEDLLKSLLLKITAKSKEFAGFVNRSPSSALAELAYAFGIVSKDLLSDIRFILKIRNEFAHSWNQLAFNHEKIAPHIPNLIGPKRFGPIKGPKPDLRQGKVASRITDMPNRMIFISAVITVSTTLEHLQSEIAPISASSRFYVDPKISS